MTHTGILGFCSRCACVCFCPCFSTDTGSLKRDPLASSRARSMMRVPCCCCCEAPLRIKLAGYHVSRTANVLSTRRPQQLTDVTLLEQLIDWVQGMFC